MQTVCVTLQEFLVKQLLSAKESSEEGGGISRGGVGWPGKEDLGGKPKAPARTDVVKVALENSLNLPILRLHSIEKNSSSEIRHSCFLLLRTTHQQIYEKANCLLLCVFIILVFFYRQRFVSSSNS